MKKSNWSTFLNILCQKFTKPIHHPGYVLFFLFIIVLINLVSIFDIIFSSSTDCANKIETGKLSLISLSFCTISLSIITSSCIEFILIKDDAKIDARQKINFAIFGVVCVIISFCALYFCQRLITINITAAFIISLLNIIFSFLFWWVANSNNESLIPTLNLKSIIAIEENIAPNNSPLKGDLSDFDA